MIKNKKGLSSIVGTLLIILLVIAAVGIVWAVLRGTIQGGANEIGLNDQCLKVSIRATAVDDSTGNYSVTYERDAGGEDIAGVSFIVSNSTDGTFYNVAGNIAPNGKKTTLIPFEDTVANATKIEVSAYLLDTEGNNYVCSTTNEFNL